MSTEVWNWMQGKVIFIHQHVAQHYKWITKKSCRLIISIDLTQRFLPSGIVTIVIIPFLTTSVDKQTIVIYITWFARLPICVIKRNAAALPYPLSFLENKVIQMKTIQCGNLRIFLPLISWVKINFGKSRVWKITISIFSDVLKFWFWKISALNHGQIFSRLAKSKPRK